MAKRNRDIEIMVARGKPDLTRPGAHEHDMRPFHGDIQPLAVDLHNDLNSSFVDSIIDEYRVTPLQS